MNGEKASYYSGGVPGDGGGSAVDGDWPDDA